MEGGKLAMSAGANTMIWFLAQYDRPACIIIKAFSFKFLDFYGPNKEKTLR
jgi:hypothetical protein